MPGAWNQKLFWRLKMFEDLKIFESLFNIDWTSYLRIARPLFVKFKL